jgi:hypothetical protein
VPDRRLGEEIAAFVRPAPAQPRPRRSSPDSAANSWRPSNGPVTGSSSTNYRSRGPAKSTSPRSAKSSTLGDTNDPADAAAGTSRHSIPGDAIRGHLLLRAAESSPEGIATYPERTSFL